jgi:hypothetical protein
MALLAIVVLPRILSAMPLSEIEMAGVNLKLRDVADEQKQQGKTLAAHEKTINDLVTFSMSAPIFRHLCGIGLLKEYNYVDNESNRREFYFLRDNGFIQPKLGGFLEFDDQTPHNVREIATATPIGRQSIKLRRSGIPVEWMTPEKKANLAVDPAAL